MNRSREEIERLKATVRIEDVVVRYVPSLRRVGERLVGLCPFHDDTEPSLNVWPATRSWYCFGACQRGGDVIDFLEEAEGLTFLEALERLEQDVGAAAAARPAPQPAASRPEREPPLDAEEHAILNAAAEIYYRTLMTNRRWRRWVEARGVSRETMRHFHVGYCSGRRLIVYLHWRRLSVEKAEGLGLHCEGREHLRYRITFPSMDGWRTPYLIGRATRDGQRPKYLGLARPKVPMVDRRRQRRRPAALVVEGPFDLLILHEWGYHKQFDLVSLLGTGVKRGWLPAFEQYEHVVVATDQDAAGQRTADELAGRMPGHVSRVTWPAEHVDVGALGQTRKGRDLFARALAEALEGGPSRGRVPPHAPSATTRMPIPA